MYVLKRLPFSGMFVLSLFVKETCLVLSTNNDSRQMN